MDCGPKSPDRSDIGPEYNFWSRRALHYESYILKVLEIGLGFDKLLDFF